LPKTTRSIAELIFVLVAVSTLFFFTINQMSMDGILPGNDPAVHLKQAKTIIMNKGVAYSEIFWYPPLFHTFLAILLLFAGTLDVMVASLMLKFMLATSNVLLLLSTYLLCRRLLGRGVAITSTMFTVLSVPLFEMISWGGYPDFLGITYIPFIFYIMNKDYRPWVKTFFLCLLTFTLVLTHQLAAFVFFLVFVPAFLISAVRSKRGFLAFIAVILGGSLAILAWYAEVILRYSNIFIYHVFFELKEAVYSIPNVNVDALIRTFGSTLFLALAGIPLTLVLLKKRKTLRVFPLLALWIAVPFFFSQSYLFGFFLNYERFIYFFATPIAIFAGVTTYSFAKAPVLITSKLSLRIRKHKILNIAQVFTIAILIGLFSYQFHLSLQRFQSFPQYYEASGIAGYNAGIWLKQNFISNGTVVVSNKPGKWFGVISDHETMEEPQSTIFGTRNLIAATILNLFYETDDTRTLTREYMSGGSISGQVMYVSVYNVWKEVLSIPDKYVYVSYLDSNGKEVVVSLSEIAKETYWMQKSANESQMVSEYSNSLFTLEKLVTIHSESPLVNFCWKFTARQDLAGIKLRVFSLMGPALEFGKAFVPGVLDWQNPWDKPSYVNTIQNWAVAECPPYILADNYAAVFDAKNSMLVVFKFAKVPDWLNVGAEVGPEGDRYIDALRTGYQFGDLRKNESGEISFSVLPYSVQPGQTEPPTQATLMQLLDSKVNLTIQERDFLTFIKEYNIKFVVIDSGQISSEIEVSPILNRVYDNGKFVIYAIKR
jgi:hypothetical protein